MSVSAGEGLDLCHDLLNVVPHLMEAAMIWTPLGIMIFEPETWIVFQELLVRFLPVPLVDERLNTVSLFRKRVRDVLIELF